MNTDYANAKNNKVHNNGHVLTPGTDIFETEGEYVVKADVPGLKKENIDITIDNGILELHGKADIEPENSTLSKREYGLYDYYRKFTVSDEIDAGNISAHIDNGVLTLVLPKREEVKPKRIEVRAH